MCWGFKPLFLLVRKIQHILHGISLLLVLYHFIWRPLRGPCVAVLYTFYVFNNISIYSSHTWDRIRCGRYKSKKQLKINRTNFNPSPTLTPQNKNWSRRRAGQRIYLTTPNALWLHAPPHDRVSPIKGFILCSMSLLLSLSLRWPFRIRNPSNWWSCLQSNPTRDGKSKRLFE